MARRTYTPLTEQVKLAQSLAEQRGGSLRVTEIATEYPSLVAAIYRNPEAFSSVNLIKRTAPNTKAFYVRQAEEIARNNGGYLPAHVDLLRDAASLTYYIVNHPKDFEHLQRGHTKARMERIRAAVAEAEALAAATGGELWVTKDFHAAHNKLVLTMRRYPEYFAHIPRRRREITSLAERVHEAEQLAAANGGTLPHQGVLRRQHEALRSMIIKNPEAFAHIPRQTCRRSTAELVKRAEEMAANNGGVLPHASAIEKIDHSLAITLYRRPKLFAHLQREIRSSGGKLLELRGGKPVETAAADVVYAAGETKYGTCYAFVVPSNYFFGIDTATTPDYSVATVVERKDDGSLEAVQSFPHTEKENPTHTSAVLTR
jgi:hypothetical protein